MWPFVNQLSCSKTLVSCYQQPISLESYLNGNIWLNTLYACPISQQNTKQKTFSSSFSVSSLLAGNRNPHNRTDRIQSNIGQNQNELASKRFSEVGQHSKRIKLERKSSSFWSPSSSSSSNLHSQLPVLHHSNLELTSAMNQSDELSSTKESLDGDCSDDVDRFNDSSYSISAFLRRSSK
jgi:hypothetical protein